MDIWTMKGDCVEDEVTPTESAEMIDRQLVLVDDDPVLINFEEYFSDGMVNSTQIIGASVVEGSRDHTSWKLTLKDGETIDYVTYGPDYDGALKSLPPAAALPELDLPNDTAGLWDDTKPPQIFERREPVDDEPTPTLEMPSEPKGSTWKDADDVSKTIEVRSSNYGLYVDQAAVELQIKRAFENTPNWSVLKPDARCALDMIATKVSRILTGKPELHDSWHDIEGYAKLVADRIQRDINSMGGSL
jgi:hypothetical protein